MIRENGTKSDELYHYGRLGMKWHKHIYGNEKALAKGSAKLKKIEGKAEKYGRRAEVLRGKNAGRIANAEYNLERAQAYQAKQAGKIFGTQHNGRANRKLARAQKQYTNAVSATRNAEANAERYRAKAATVWGKMEREFGTKAVSKLDNGKAVTGKNYSDWYMNKYAKYKVKAQKKAERAQKKAAKQAAKEAKRASK